MVDTEDSKSSAPKACGFESRPGYRRPESELELKSRPGRVLLHALRAEMIPAGFPKLLSVKPPVGMESRAWSWWSPTGEPGVTSQVRNGQNLRPGLTAK